MKSSTGVPHCIKCFYLHFHSWAIICVAFRKTGRGRCGWISLLHTSQSTPVTFSWVLWMVVLVVIFFSFYFFNLFCYRISSHLASSDWKPRLPTLGCNELILCVCGLACVLAGFSSQLRKPSIWKFERVWKPLCPSFSTTLLQGLLKDHSAAFLLWRVPDLACKSPFKCASKQAELCV